MVNLAKNKWLVKDGDHYIGLPEPDTEEEAQEVQRRLNLTGTLITREDYQRTVGDAIDANQNELRTLFAELSTLSWMKCIKPECLTPQGQRALEIIQRIDSIQS